MATDSLADRAEEIRQAAGGRVAQVQRDASDAVAAATQTGRDAWTGAQQAARGGLTEIHRIEDLVETLARYGTFALWAVAAIGVIFVIVYFGGPVRDALASVVGSMSRG